MKTRLAVLALLSVVAAASLRAEIIEQILVKVNGEIFTKTEMTRGSKEDPRAPGGVFEQVGGLLSDLLDRG